MNKLFSNLIAFKGTKPDLNCLSLYRFHLIAFLALAPVFVGADSAIDKKPQAKITQDKATQHTATHGNENSNYKEVDTDSLKKMMDEKKPMLIFDARKKLKGGLLPGAKNLPYDVEDKELEKTLGSVSKNTMIVVYCANLYCPLSKFLAERLVLKGFVNVYKYPDGVAGWLDKDYFLEPIPPENA